MAHAPKNTKIYAVGDVHGQLGHVQNLLPKIAADAAAWKGRKVLLFVGDLVDRGPHSKEVMELLVHEPLKADGFEQIAIRGNHEWKMHRFVDSLDNYEAWFKFGGIAALHSYGVRYTPTTPVEEAQADFNQAIPQSHVEFLEKMPLTHIEGDYLFVHAGVRPGVPLEEQEEYDLQYMREPFLSWPHGLPYTVVFGHTTLPQGKPLVDDDKIGIDTGAYMGGPLTAVVLWEDQVDFIQVTG